MTEQIHVSVGLDLHKKFIIATLLTDTGFREQRRFERTESGLFNHSDHFELKLHRQYYSHLKSY